MEGSKPAEEGIDPSDGRCRSGSVDRVFAQVPAAVAQADLANVLARAKACGLDGLVLVQGGTRA